MTDDELVERGKKPQPIKKHHYVGGEKEEHTPPEDLTHVVSPPVQMYH